MPAKKQKSPAAGTSRGATSAEAQNVATGDQGSARQGTSSETTTPQGRRPELQSPGGEFGSAREDSDSEAPGPGHDHNMERPPRDEQRAVGAFKVPAFDPNRADRFFNLAEDRFIALGIYHHALKYSCVVEYLPPHLLELVQTKHEEIAASRDRYLAVKTAVLAYTLRPFWTRMNAIETLPSVGSISPTQLMCKIIGLRTPGEPFHDMLRYMFLRRLPGPLFEKYKNHPVDPKDPMQLAVRVEQDWTAGMNGPKINVTPLPSAAATAPDTPPPPAAVAQIEEESPSEEFWRPMVAAMQAMRRGVGGRGSNRGRGRGQRGGRGGGNNNGDQLARGDNRGGAPNQSQAGRTAPAGWCFFHQRFGKDAYS